MRAEGSEFAVPDSKTAIAEAEEKGLIAVFPGSNQLQLDLDDEDGWATYIRNRDIVKQYWGIKDTKIEVSKSGMPRRHITLTLDRNVSDLERIGLQAVLGSDLKREEFSLVRVLQGDPHPTLFFEKST